MRRLHFSGNNEIITIEINKKKVIITIPSLNVYNFPIEKILYSKKFVNRKKMIEEYPDLEGLPQEKLIEECQKRWKALINDLETEQNIKIYVINEMESQGLTYVGGEK